MAHSWEQVVSWVSIGSSDGHVQQSAQTWERVFSELDTIRANVTRLKQAMTTAWSGETAKAFTQHLTKVEQALTEIIENSRRIATGLHEAAAHLRQAVGDIPV